MQNSEQPRRTLQSIADGLVVKAQAPISDVQAQIEYLEDSIAKLDAASCNLLARLSPVLCPCADPSERPGPARALASTELAVQISTLASRVDSVRGALADAHGRLGI
ncbi:MULTISPECIES: hypothetical protein [Acidovorax]|uniref:Uncharacterized protein n=1 Tax=Acidovorax facilis TaxID=12917 RepID=A0ABV8DAR8_9BURK|nr:MULTISPECIES: hypothetical protein [Acidovorax]KQB59340.1 hypothetical protein AE621_10460 [Acidovorax sp. SD340]MBO1007126.1 hypothetical protein [Acidovorax sp. SD340]MCO4240888.1 hypothetical protein [Acidovorax facilis]